MSLSTPANIRPYHNSLSSDVKDSFLLDMIFNAETMLRDWIGDSEYETAESALLSPDTIPSANLRKYKRYANAEKELVMYHAVSKLNVVITSSGVIQSTQSQKFGDATFTIASPSQIEQIRNTYFQEAERLVYGTNSGLELQSRIGGTE